MARMPQAQWLGERSPRNSMSRYDIVCVHTIVGYAPAHAAHFSVHQGGTIQQSRDTRYRSAANLNGNHRVIAIENEDHGSAFPSWSGSNVPALTDAQVEANAQILAWAHKEHGVPLQLCPNSRPTSRGLAYHRQGIDGNFGPFKYGGRVSGGEVWTEHFGKVCPGDRRIDQLPAILARAKQIVNGERMAIDKDDVRTIARTDGVFDAPPDSPGAKSGKNKFWHLNSHIRNLVNHVLYRKDLWWKVRLRWYGTWTDHEATEERYPNGYTAQAHTVHGHRLSRENNILLKEIRAENNAFFAEALERLEVMRTGGQLTDEQAAELAENFAIRVRDELGKIQVVVGVEDADPSEDEPAPDA